MTGAIFGSISSPVSLLPPSPFRSVLPTRRSRAFLRLLASTRRFSLCSPNAPFGSSRQLMTGPDAATCIMAAASIGAVAGGDPQRYMALMVALTLMTGPFNIVAGIARLGFIANFLSQPILVGYLNGIALIILVGQLPKLFG